MLKRSRHFLILERQRDRLAEVRRRRDSRTVQQCLGDLHVACREPDKPLMPYIVDAVRAYATIGEISHTMRDVFGVFQEPVVM